MPAGIRTQDLLLRRQLLYPTELQAHILPLKGKKVERVMGIEPTYPAWKAGVLPMNYTRTCDFVSIPNKELFVNIFFEKI